MVIAGQKYKFLLKGLLTRFIYILVCLNNILIGKELDITKTSEFWGLRTWKHKIMYFFIYLVVQQFNYPSAQSSLSTLTQGRRK